jgi:dTDP-4-amino-4,6-dideoxygalactose transaminase
MSRQKNMRITMKVPLLDLKIQYQTVKNEILKAVEDIFDSQNFILGPQVEALEKEIAGYCLSGYAVGVSSGSDALLISLMAAGIGPGDIVITTPYTFFATAGSIARVGARPVFADIDPDTYNISPERLESLIMHMTAEEQSRIKAMIPVHLYGQCADMDPILEIARKYDLFLIEDAAQAIGAEYKGRRAGSMGDAGCFSFFPSKNLGAFGDGGMVTTHSKDLYERLRILRVHGSNPKYYHRAIGGNFRLDALQAAVVLVKLRHLDDWTRSRQRNASEYRKLFQNAGLENFIKLPKETEQRHIYNQFVISVPEKRDDLHRFLKEAGIGTEIYYPVPLHLQECFSYLNYQEGAFPVAEYAARHTLALPVYPELSADQQLFVVEKIKGFYSGH